MTETRIPLVAVLGHPVAHSRSPNLHGYWLRHYKLPGHYVPIDVAPADLEEVLAMLPRLGFVGANVTIPHKEAVLALADTVSGRAELIGAANTLVFERGGGLQADNTDGYGFTENLRRAVPDWDPKAAPAGVFGAGGACRAIVAALLELGVPEIRLSNRTETKAEALAEQFGDTIKVIPWDEPALLLADAGTVVNTTSLGMVGQAAFTVPLDAMQPGAVATDLVYTPLETPFLAAARLREAQIVDGLGMLLHQAVPGFERWFGVRPEVTDAARDIVLAA